MVTAALKTEVGGLVLEQLTQEKSGAVGTTGQPSTVPLWESRSGPVGQKWYQRQEHEASPPFTETEPCWSQILNPSTKTISGEGKNMFTQLTNNALNTFLSSNLISMTGRCCYC